MIQSLITSQTRIKLLLKFFLNPKTKGYLRQLAKEFGESTNSIRVELNKLTEAHMLTAQSDGRNKVYNANTEHPLFEDIRNIVLKSTGIDKIIQDIINKIGKIDLAFLRGDYASGKDSGLIDLVVVGKEINTAEVERVRLKTEDLIKRKISVLILSRSEYATLKENLNIDKSFILFNGETV